MRLLKLFPLLVRLVLTACGKQEIETNMVFCSKAF